MKKNVIIAVIIVFILQLFVPLYMIWEKYDVLRTGEEVKIKVEPIDPYDAFRGRYVSLWYDYELGYEERKGRYGILETGEDGFSVVKRVSNEKPENELYLMGKEEGYFYIPLDRYYMEETLAPEAEKVISGGVEAYITVRIKGDKSVISGLYAEGMPIEEYLERDF